MSNDTYTVVTTMKNESPYILEWVAHYKTLGFDNILVCTNDCTDPTDDILKRLEEMGLVTHHATVIRKGGIQRSALRQANRYDIVKQAEWVYVCDVDEYLNIHMGDGSVRAMVEGTPGNADVIAVPWRIFGSNGVSKLVDEPIKSQFTQGEHEFDPTLRPETGKFVKSLYRNQYKFSRMGIHAPVQSDAHLKETIRVLPGGAPRMVNGVAYDSPPVYTHAQVNHYAVRSLDSYLIKRARGRANHMHHVVGMDYWTKFNLNDVPDSSISRYEKAESAYLKELKSDSILGELHEKAVDWHKRKADSIRMDPELEELVTELEASLAGAT